MADRIRDNVVLGTALWGWGVERRDAHAMLDRYTSRGGQLIDAAVNYPINDNPEAFGEANDILAEWLEQNPGSDAKVFLKVGALDNSGGPHNALGASDLHLAIELARARFGQALFGVGIHWDNREDPGSITESLGVMREAANAGFHIGFSGVKRPDFYADAAPDLADLWWIQVKENAQTSNARHHYAEHFPNAKYLAYGINMGGVKDAQPDKDSSLSLRGLTQPSVSENIGKLLSLEPRLQPWPKTFNQFALLYQTCNPSVDGVIIGPRNIQQLQDTVSYLAQLDAAGIGPCEDLYRSLTHDLHGA